ncbi:oxidoreductase [Chitinophaga sp. Cy-1792]|uniref:oxidoreductase n=1 Tax=Chitinophaga sp. Cy-1792 TaxID=2608339 RepID=UPI00141E69DF|nr:oxidoreductase [Chitinophaga sp. Cy-1792]NIG55574.1 SDR family NAD(P)-dependent oxidoreductase [Chitinophaga sp. Cy-1792]
MKKVVLITGASTGMGRETALLLARSGYTVYAAARRTALMQDLIPEGIQVLSMDVTIDAQMVAGIDTIITREGRLDILINNAGFGSYGAIEDVPMADAKYQLDVNVFGAMRLVQLALPYMRNQGGGRIVNISSIGGKIATPFGGWYHASKFALEGLSDSLRNEVKPFNIAVIVIEPGGVKSEWGDIAARSLMKVSGNGVYKSMVERFAKAFEKTMHKNADPMVIAQLIKKALQADRPKTRYHGGYMAGPILAARKIFGDRMIDNVISSQLK